MFGLIGKIFGKKSTGRALAAAGLKSKKGFTLIEILVAMSILTIGMLGIAGLATTSMRSANYAKDLTNATNVAQDRIEALLTIPFENITVTDLVTARTDLRRTCTLTDATINAPVYTCIPSTAQILVDNAPYVWGYKVTILDLDGSGTSVLGQDNLVRIDLTVTWTDALFGASKSISMVTLRGVG